MRATANRPPPIRISFSAVTSNQATCMDNLVDTVHGDPLPQPVQQQLTAAAIGLDTLLAEPCGVKG